MRYINLLALVIPLILLSCNVSEKLASGNLLVNSSFAQQLDHWQARSAANTSSKFEVASEGVLMMKSDVPVEDKYIYENSVEQCVKLDQGEKYRLQAKFKATQVLSGEYADKAAFANRIYIVWYESLDCSRGGQSGGWIEPKNISAWQTLAVDNQTPAFGAKAAMIKVTQNGRYSRGYAAYWDNIQFFATAFATAASQDPRPPNSEYTRPLNENYLVNASFSENLSDWRSYRSIWASEGYRIPGSAKVSYESKKDSFGTDALSQCVNIGENTEFIFGAMVKKDPESTQKGGGRMRITWHNKENCGGRGKTDSHWADFEDIQDWYELKGNNLHAPEHSQSVLIELIQSVAGPGIYSVYWDDVYFKAVE